MKYLLTIEDRPTGLDVSLTGLVTDGFPSNGESLASMCVASLVLHLKRVAVIGKEDAVVIRENGKEVPWPE